MIKNVPKKSIIPFFMRQILLYRPAIVSLAVSAGLMGCGSKIDFQNIKIANGKFLVQGEQLPFSGTVLNVPFNKIPFTPIAPIVQFATLTAKEYVNVFYSDITLITTVKKVLCNAPTSKGSFDGTVVCKYEGNEILRVSFKGGVINGKVKLISSNEKGKKVTEVSFENGRPQGKMDIYSGKTGKKTFHATWKDGYLTGPSESYYLDTGRLSIKGNWQNNQEEGEFVQYDTSGKVMVISHFRSGINYKNINPNALPPAPLPQKNTPLVSEAQSTKLSTSAEVR